MARLSAMRALRASATPSRASRIASPGDEVRTWADADRGSVIQPVMMRTRIPSAATATPTPTARKNRSPGAGPHEEQSATHATTADTKANGRTRRGIVGRAIGHGHCTGLESSINTIHTTNHGWGSCPSTGVRHDITAKQPASTELSRSGSRSTLVSRGSWPRRPLANTSSPAVGSRRRVDGGTTPDPSRGRPPNVAPTDPSIGGIGAKPPGPMTRG